MRRAPPVRFVIAVAVAISSGVLAADAPLITLTILHGNYIHNDSFRAEWGFACLIDGLEKTILFDAGGWQCALRPNIEAAGIEASAIDAIVLSHVHEDHIGGFACLLPLPHDTAVYVSSSFPSNQHDRFEVPGAIIPCADGPTEICADAITTGEIDGPVIEQALVLRTASGLVVVTGCAHPGIVAIVEAAQALFPAEPIALVLGGFHLADSSETMLRTIARRLIELGVERIAPTPCSGDLTREVFRELFGASYLEAGVGLVLEL
ncbi:MBL fold metallo-hydrolase [Candidatus Bipolaricaulota bacterium]|nr:MBL fold metallo-hydrolase [Candidatus Bipolaricaulota bacterium]